MFFFCFFYLIFRHVNGLFIAKCRARMLQTAANRASFSRFEQLGLFVVLQLGPLSLDVVLLLLSCFLVFGWFSRFFFQNNLLVLLNLSFLLLDFVILKFFFIFFQLLNFQFKTVLFVGRSGIFLDKLVQSVLRGNFAFKFCFFFGKLFG